MHCGTAHAERSSTSATSTTSSSSSSSAESAAPRSMSEAGKSSSSQNSEAPPIIEAADSLWGGIYRFTCVFDQQDGRHKGFEASCACKEHFDLSAAGKKIPCRKTLSFSAHGGVDRTVRILRWWCLQGAKHASKKKHMQAAYPAEPPSLKQLEEMLAAEPGTDAPAASSC